MGCYIAIDKKCYKCIMYYSFLIVIEMKLLVAVAAALLTLAQGGVQYDYLPPSQPQIYGIPGRDYDGFIPTDGGGVLVQKHIYFHVPPAEPEELRPQKRISLGQATRNYKIIFIKAPSAPAPTSPSFSLGGQNEEKTLVYVLVKKPDDAPDISIPTAAPTAPSKPEVYFIRYKAKSVGETSSGRDGIIGGRVTDGVIGGRVNDGIIGGRVTDGIIGGRVTDGIIGGRVTDGIADGRFTDAIVGGRGIVDGRGILTGPGSTSYVVDGSPSIRYGPPGQN